MGPRRACSICRCRRTATLRWQSRRTAFAAERCLALAGYGGSLDCVKHAVAGDRVVEGGAEVRSLAVVAGEMCIRLGDVRGRAWGLGRRPSILLWHRQELERRLVALVAA